MLETLTGSASTAPALVVLVTVSRVGVTTAISGETRRVAPGSVCGSLHLRGDVGAQHDRPADRAEPLVGLADDVREQPSCGVAGGPLGEGDPVGHDDVLEVVSPVVTDLLGVDVHVEGVGLGP